MCSSLCGEHGARTGSLSTRDCGDVCHGLLLSERLFWSVTDSLGWLQILAGLCLPGRVPSKVNWPHYDNNDKQTPSYYISERYASCCCLLSAHIPSLQTGGRHIRWESRSPTEPCTACVITFLLWLHWAETINCVNWLSLPHARLQSACTLRERYGNSN